MRIAYKDRAGGVWKEYQNTKGIRKTIAEQVEELSHVGNIIIATVRGNKINRRVYRGY